MGKQIDGRKHAFRVQKRRCRLRMLLVIRKESTDAASWVAPAHLLDKTGREYYRQLHDYCWL